jgi:hypothetical protein
LQRFLKSPSSVEHYAGEFGTDDALDIVSIVVACAARST